MSASVHTYFFAIFMGLCTYWATIHRTTQLGFPGARSHSLYHIDVKIFHVLTEHDVNVNQQCFSNTKNFFLKTMLSIVPIFKDFILLYIAIFACFSHPIPYYINNPYPSVTF